MAAPYPSQEHRPLKKPRLGPPDVYPQDPKQKEVSKNIYLYVDIFRLSIAWLSFSQNIHNNRAFTNIAIIGVLFRTT